MAMYTGKGDGGMTVLANGKQVSKSHDLIMLIGQIDHLNSCIAAAYESIPQPSKSNETTIAIAFIGTLVATGGVFLSAIVATIVGVFLYFVLQGNMKREVKLEALRVELRYVMNVMFALGSMVASPEEYHELKETPKTKLVQAINYFNPDCPRLKDFILPIGNTGKSSAFHVARTQCRIVEEHIVAARENHVHIPAETVAFLNRLSSLLFVAARYVGGDVPRRRPEELETIVNA